MELLLNNVLNLTEEEINNSKIEFNMQAGSGGQSFLGRWLKHTDEEKETGACKNCSYWGWYGKQRNFSILDNGFSALQECKRMSGCLYLQRR